jgi:hypothetical protein
MTEISARTYCCPMHPDVSEAGPGKCPRCGMELLPEDTRFGLLRHMLGKPVHLVIMLAAMLALMAAGMKILQ